MKKINFLMLTATSFTLILIITSMAFASAHQMNYNGNMQGRNSNGMYMQTRNSNFMSMHTANNYMHMNQQNNFMHSISSSGNLRMNSQRNLYMHMPNNQHTNAYMRRF